MNSDSNIVGSFIYQQRKMIGLTQKELADKLNITNKAVSKWETGECYPDITIMPILASIFNCTVDDILNGAKAALVETDKSNTTATQKIVEPIIEKKEKQERKISFNKKNKRYLFFTAITLAVILVISIPLCLYFSNKKTYA